MSSLYSESSSSLVKDSAETMDLGLKGFEDWSSIPLSQHASRAMNSLNVSTGNASHPRTVYTTELNNDLLYIATIMKQSRKLRILRIHATSELHPLLHLLQRRDYLCLSTICTFLSAIHLTILELDLCGTQMTPDQSQEHSEGLHVCISIAALLTTLQRLRLRTRSICADALKLQQYSANLNLKEMILNLSLSDESSLATSATHATCCGSSTGGFLQLKVDMEQQARVLVDHMAAPKTVRILTHAFPSFEMRAFDVLTGKNIMLSEDAVWDDVSEAMEDQESDEESEIPDLSSDDDG